MVLYDKRLSPLLRSSPDIIHCNILLSPFPLPSLPLQLSFCAASAGEEEKVEGSPETCGELRPKLILPRQKYKSRFRCGFAVSSNTLHDFSRFSKTFLPRSRAPFGPTVSPKASFQCEAGECIQSAQEAKRFARMRIYFLLCFFSLIFHNKTD